MWAECEWTDGEHLYVSIQLNAHTSCDFIKIVERRQQRVVHTLEVASIFLNSVYCLEFIVTIFLNSMVKTCHLIRSSIETE